MGDKAVSWSHGFQNALVFSDVLKRKKMNILGYIGDLGVSLGQSYSSRIAWTPLFIQPVAFTPHGGDYMEVIIPCVKILKILPK